MPGPLPFLFMPGPPPFAPSMAITNDDSSVSTEGHEDNPWAAFFENLEARKDPAWKCDQTSPETCLTNLPVDPIDPAGVEPIVSGDPQSFLDTLRTYAREHVEAELLQERENIWAQEPVEGQMPANIFLKGETKFSQMSFHGWIPIITQDLGCDKRACDAFVKLFSKNPQACTHGYNEGCRVIAHALKDKIKPVPPLGPQEPENWSRYFKKCCKEAIEALDNWEHVQELKKDHHSGWNYYAEPSSSSKGKGKGTYLFEGLRD